MCSAAERFVCKVAATRDIAWGAFFWFLGAARHIAFPKSTFLRAEAHACESRQFLRAHIFLDVCFSEVRCASEFGLCGGSIRHFVLRLLFSRSPNICTDIACFARWGRGSPDLCTWQRLNVLCDDCIVFCVCVPKRRVNHTCTQPMVPLLGLGRDGVGRAWALGWVCWLGAWAGRGGCWCGQVGKVYV